MSCCLPPPRIVVGAVGDFPTGIQDYAMLSGETTECYTASATNPTGKHDDATENVPNKIDTPTIPLRKDASVDVTFKLQDGSDQVPSDWTLVDSDTGAAFAAVGVTFTSNGSTATLVGTFTSPDYGKKFRVLLTALDGATEIDSRSYVFSPALGTEEDSLRLQHPLPGAICTSRFNPNRKHPVTGIIKAHKGCDFALAGGKVADVLCAADGEVIFTGFEDGGAGNYVKVKHVNSQGKHLCTTVYMHLAKIYVAAGQKIPAGGKIGLEGNTGIGTGAHLHFEVRLPNEARIDPIPLIAGTVLQADQTNPDNTAVETSIRTSSANAVLTPAEVDAKVSGCTPYGSDYPVPSKPLPPASIAPLGTTFDYAWDLTLKTEVIGWAGTPPTVPDTIAGLIDTKEQRRNVGFVDHPADPGGVTKFGVAQRFNKGLKVVQADYATARDVAFTNFWEGKLPSDLDATQPHTAVAVFNIAFLCGLGGAKIIVDAAKITSLSDNAAVDAVCDQLKIYLNKKVQEQPAKRVFQAGWMARAETIRSYCKSLP